MRGHKWLLCALVTFCVSSCALASTQEEDKENVAVVTGKVSPPGIGAEVAAYATPFMEEKGRVRPDLEGKYRLELPAGNYIIVAIREGYVYGQDASPLASGLRVIAGDHVEELNFHLVRGAIISGRITGAAGRTLVAAVRRVPSWKGERKVSGGDAVAAGTGTYRIQNLRPGAYDLLIISSNRGIVEGMLNFAGVPDSLSKADRDALLDMNRRYEQARASGNLSAALEFYSKDYSDGADQTYAQLVEQVQAQQKQPSERRVHAFLWRILALEGTGDMARAIVHRDYQWIDPGMKEPSVPERHDWLVEYRREEGRWRILRASLLRSYGDLSARISGLTGEPCIFRPDYIAIYCPDPNISNIVLNPGEQSRDHNLDLSKAKAARPPRP
jgi:hypothetical protein